MKRFGRDGSDPVGVPGRFGTSRRRSPRSANRVLALTTSLGSDALRAAGFSGARAREFEEFVSGDRGRSAGFVPLPDPAFREGLRRRLWRIQVLARRVRGLATH